MSSTVRLDGGEVLLEQATSYPEQGDIEIMIDPRKSFEFTVSLRIPAWSAVSMVTVNGQSVDGATPGEYLRLKRRWEAGDRIGVKLDMRGPADPSGRISGDRARTGRIGPGHAFRGRFRR